VYSAIGTRRTLEGMSRLSLEPALRLLDGVQNRSQIEAFSPDAFASLVGAAVASVGEGAGREELVAALDELRLLFKAIEQFTTRCFRIRLDFAVDGLPVPAELRKYLAVQGTSYAGNLATLHERVASAVARLDPAAAQRTADAVVEVAERMIASRAALLEGVFATVRKLASSRIEGANNAGRDRSLPEAERKSWRAAALDLRLLAGKPERLAEKSFADRVAVLEVPEEELEPEPEGVSRFKLIEID
jgi:hypothetical protein